MNLNITKIIQSILTDSKWYIKLFMLFALYGLIIFVNYTETSSTIIRALFTIIFWPSFLLVLGYIVNFIHNIINDYEILLPSINASLIPKYIKNGIWVSIISILSIIICKLFSVLIYKLMPLIFEIRVYDFSLVEIIFLVFASLTIGMYSINLKIKDCINFKEVFELVKIRKVEWLIYSLGIVFTLVAYYFISFYASLTFARLILFAFILILANFVSQIIRAHIQKAPSLNINKLKNQKATLFLVIFIGVIFSLVLLTSINEKYKVYRYIRDLHDASYRCYLSTAQVNDSLLEGNYSEKLIKRGVKYCQESIPKIKRVTVPNVKLEKNHILLEKYKKSTIKECKCSIQSNYSELKTKNSEEQYQSKMNCDPLDNHSYKILEQIRKVYD